jgi:hypothetical protein
MVGWAINNSITRTSVLAELRSIMTTQAIKNKLAKVFPQATKIRVRQYPMSYKGTMRGYTDINVKGVSINYYEFQDKCRTALGSLDHTFVSEN